MFRLIAASVVVAVTFATCPEGTFTDVKGTSCFAVVVNRLPWSDAEKVCQVYGGHLASVAEFDVDSIRKLNIRSSPRTDLWLGGKSEEGRWYWTDGSELKYVNWANGEPSINDDRCIAQTKEGTWHARDCQRRKPFICRIPTSPFNIGLHNRNSCEAGWTYSNVTEKCYKLVKNVKFTDAYRTCSDLNSTTPSVRNAREIEWLSDLFRLTVKKSFVGLVFNAADDKWEWMDGTAVSPWYATRGEPNNAGGRECWLWNDGTCAEDRDIICEKDVE